VSADGEALGGAAASGATSDPASGLESGVQSGVESGVESGPARTTWFGRRRRTRAPRGPVTVSRLGVPLLIARDASTFVTRLRGLHGMPPLGPTDALLIRPCRAIQTWRMRGAIDVAFLDRQGLVLRIETVPPGSVRVCAKACAVLEMASGTAARLSLAPGHVLSTSSEAWT